jgi:hypothetical protein
VVLVLALAVPASANTPDSFSACAKKAPDARCRGSISVLAGKTVYLKGKVSPPHANLEAELWHQAPDLSVELLATVPIGDLGGMKYVWETTTADGSQTDPNWFQFRIPGHGESNDVEVMVFFGE